MILDTSAIVAILALEDDAATFAAAIESAERVGISAGTVLEAAMVLGRSRSTDLDAFLVEASVEVMPVGDEHLAVARRGWAQHGRGGGSPARLNYGDCFAYAAAIVTDRPLLFKGDDFSHTDVRNALD